MSWLGTLLIGGFLVGCWVINSIVLRLQVWWWARQHDKRGWEGAVMSNEKETSRLRGRIVDASDREIARIDTDSLPDDPEFRSATFNGSLEALTIFFRAKARLKRIEVNVVGKEE